MKNSDNGSVAAEYIPQVVEDYKGNPFIEALPPIMSTAAAMEALAMRPPYNEGERELDAHYRCHSIQRLFRYFQPLDTHIDIEGRFSRCIRQGYVPRNPVGSQYARQLQQGGDAIQARSLEASDFRSIRSTACGFTVIGMSGVGKSTGVERVLSQYPQCITHTRYQKQPLYVKQVVWLKLDCPFDGSIKGLCISFFNEIDRILNSEYSRKFSAGKHTVDMMLPRMAQIASTHGVGLLVIDEIQHLSQAKSGGSEKMLNFFVTLVNTIGIPVVLIGTTKAMPILQSEFRQARRGSGQGDLLWDRMKNDTAWEIMLRTMWKYQWTKKKFPLSAEMQEAMYDESQGIIDIAVKLYAMAQITAIAQGKETVTPALIRKVAAGQLRLVRPMLAALRSGDIKKIAQYEDIRPIDVEDYIAAQVLHLPTATEAPPVISSLEEQAVLALLGTGIPAPIARKSVRKAMAGATAGQPLASVTLKAVKLAARLMEGGQKAVQPEVPDEDDIRVVAESGHYDDLQAAGVIADEKDTW